MRRPIDISRRSGVKGALAITPGRAIRQFCMECVGASNARAAFDCLSQVCPLYPCHPFRGKAMPKRIEDREYELDTWGNPREFPWEPPDPKSLAKKRRPSRRLIIAQCRDCQPDDRTDCAVSNCPLYRFRPWPGPGKAPRRNLSDKRLAQIAAARQRSPLTPSRKREQKASTSVGAAFDA